MSKVLSFTSKNIKNARKLFKLKLLKYHKNHPKKLIKCSEIIFVNLLYPKCYFVLLEFQQWIVLTKLHRTCWSINSSKKQVAYMFLNIY